MGFIFAQGRVMQKKSSTGRMSYSTWDSDTAELSLTAPWESLPLFAYPCPAGIKLLDDVDWHSLYQETCRCFAMMHVNVLPLCSGFLSGVGTRIERHRM